MFGLILLITIIAIITAAEIRWRKGGLHKSDNEQSNPAQMPDMRT